MRILMLTFGLCITSCGWYKSAVYHSPAKPIRTVAVVIVQDDAGISNEELEAEHVTFAKTLAEELCKMDLFHFKILERHYSLHTLDANEKEMLGKELMDQYDAFLLCIPVPRGVADYSVEVSLFQSGTALQLVSARHNTSLLYSYGFSQRASVRLIDATRGALVVFEHSWSKME